jgi:hypothetical protein
LSDRFRGETGQTKVEEPSNAPEFTLRRRRSSGKILDLLALAATDLDTVADVRSAVVVAPPGIVPDKCRHSTVDLR